MGISNPFKGMSKPELYAVIAGGTLIAFYAEFSHHKKTGSWSPFATTPVAPAGAATGNNPLTGLPYADDSVTDPMTGQTYLAEAQQYGSVAAAEASVSAWGSSTASGSGIGVNPASPPSTGSVNTTVGGSIYTSDSAWAQAVQAGLSSVSGSQQYDGTDIGTALGAYLQGQPLDPNQAKVVSTAIAEYGNPPVGTFQIIPGGTTTTGTTVTTTTPPSSGGGALAFAVPDGMGHWMNASFPNQAAVTAFYSSLGIVNGAYPPGLTNAQTTSAVKAAGGTITSGTGLAL